MSKAYEFGASLGRKGGQPWVRFSTWLLLGLSPEGAADVVGYAASGTGGGVVTAAVAVDALEAYAAVRAPWKGPRAEEIRQSLLDGLWGRAARDGLPATMHWDADGLERACPAGTPERAAVDAVRASAASKG